MRADPRFYKDQLKESVEFSLAENPFNKNETFGKMSKF